MAEQSNKSQATIEKILNAAEKLFAEKGYDKTSMQDMTRLAGVSKGAIYHHFQSKEAIIRAVLDRQNIAFKSTYTSWLKEAQQMGLNSKERLVHLMKRSVLNQDTFSQSAEEQMSQSPEAIVNAILFNQKEGTPLLANMLREGIADGSIQTAYPDEFASAFLLLFNFWVNPIWGTKLGEDEIKRRYHFVRDLSVKMGVDIFPDDWAEELIIPNKTED